MISKYKGFGIFVIAILWMMTLSLSGPVVGAQEATTEEQLLRQNSDVMVPDISETDTMPNQTTIAPPPDPPGSFEETEDSTTSPSPVIETTIPTETTTLVETVTTVGPIKPVPTKPVKKPIYRGFSNSPLPVFDTKQTTNKSGQSDRFNHFIKLVFKKSNIVKQGDIFYFLGDNLFQTAVEFNTPSELPYPIKVTHWVLNSNFKIFEFFCL